MKCQYCDGNCQRPRTFNLERFRKWEDLKYMGNDILNRYKLREVFSSQEVGGSTYGASVGTSMSGNHNGAGSVKFTGSVQKSSGKDKDTYSLDFNLFSQ